MGSRCPIPTAQPCSAQEAAGYDVGEIRAYKLGKKRWSYNQVELLVQEGPGGQNRHLAVKQAAHLPDEDGADEDGGVSFDIVLSNDERVKMRCYLVYDSPITTKSDGSAGNKYLWPLVDRCDCQRGCSGPVLRAIQRFGKLGKRSWTASPSPDPSDKTNSNMKDQRYIYLSFDEAGTHVGVRSFRLVVALFDAATGAAVGTAVSPPVRVLANNDVPTGAAHIGLQLYLPATWAGWASAPEMLYDRPLLSFDARLAAAGLDAQCVAAFPHPPPLQRAASGDLSGPASDVSSDGGVPALLGARGGGGGASPTPSPSPSPYRTRRHAAAAAAAAQQQSEPAALLAMRHEEYVSEAPSEQGSPERMPAALRHMGSLELWARDLIQEAQLESPTKRARYGGAGPARQPPTPLPHAAEHEAAFPQLGLHAAGQIQYLAPTTGSPAHGGRPAGEPSLEALLGCGGFGHEESQMLQECAELISQGQHRSPVVCFHDGADDDGALHSDKGLGLAFALGTSPPAVPTPLPSALDDFEFALATDLQFALQSLLPGDDASLDFLTSPGDAGTAAVR